MARPGLNSLLALASLLALWALAVSPAAAETDGGADELAMKSSFVLNFIRLVYWTDMTGEVNTSELPVCALSNTEFYAAVRRGVDGKTVGKRVARLKVEPNPDATRCRVLLVDVTEYRSAVHTLRLLSGAPVLTIGNGEGFLDIGGMLELVKSERKVRFDAGLHAIQRARLDISARLLTLARKRPKGG